MNATRTMSQLLRSTLALSLSGLLLAPLPLQAALVDNSQLAQQTQAARPRAELQRLLARDDVRAALLELGVSAGQVEQRVDQLTAAELEQMQARLAQLPAGADSGVGLVLGIIFIFIVLDLLGATDVFPRI